MDRLWRTEGDLAAALERIRGSGQVASALARDKSEMIELELVGGEGPA